MQLHQPLPHTLVQICFQSSDLWHHERYKLRGSLEIDCSITHPAYNVKVTDFVLQACSEYLVLWEDYPKEEASWVNKQNITQVARVYAFFGAHSAKWR